jgi:predicted extracellular nuclease
VLAALDADVIGLNELENTLDVDPLGDPQDGLLAGLNSLGAGTYAAIDTGVIGTDAIRVGLIYRPDAVTPVGDFETLDESDDPRFNTDYSRPALAQTFRENATGALFTVVVNHLKSKGSDCEDLDDPDTGDGQGNCNLTRLAAAQALVDWAQSDPTGSGDRDYLIIGDLNSYAKEDPIDAIRAGPDDILGTTDDYTNLIEKFGGAHAYSYVFDGQAGYLDHALSSATLTGQVTGATEWHIDADEPSILDYDTSFKPAAQEELYEPNAYRASDHDPVIVGLNLLDFGYEGFVGPIRNPPTVNQANAGSTIPILFTLDGLTDLDVLFTDPISTPIDCTTREPLDDPETLASAVGLVYDGNTGVYRYEWKTPRSMARTCQLVELTLDDGTFRNAIIQFR